MTMKTARIFTVIALVACAAIPLEARAWDFGIKLGLNQTSLTNTDGSDGLSALTAGVYFENQFTNYQALYVEFAYSNRKSRSFESVLTGFWFDGYDLTGFPAPDRIVRTETNYLDFAALWKLFVQDEHRNGPYILVGPVFSVLISGQRALELGYTADLKADVDYQKAVISYAFGGGIDFDIRGLRSSLDIRATRALTAFGDSNGIYGHKNNLFSATVGICLAHSR